VVVSSVSEPQRKKKGGHPKRLLGGWEKSMLQKRDNFLKLVVGDATQAMESRGKKTSAGMEPKRTFI